MWNAMIRITGARATPWIFGMRQLHDDPPEIVIMVDADCQVRHEQLGLTERHHRHHEQCRKDSQNGR
jgi:hypothetical protein